MITYSVLVMQNRKTVAQCTLHRQGERILPAGSRIYIEDVIPAAIVDYTALRLETNSVCTMASIVVDYDTTETLNAMLKAGWNVHRY